MTPKQVEEKIIELIHREPFVPFVVEVANGQSLEFLHPRLAINGGGAVFFGPDGGLVDFEFNTVRSIRELRAETVISAVDEQIISLTPADQATFWSALSSPAKLTPDQRKLGEVMRGES